MLKIDMHTHILPEKIPAFAQKFGYGDFIQLEHHKEGWARMMKGERFFREIASNCWDPEERIQEYAQHGTSVQVVCTVPVMFSYWAKTEDGWDVSRFLNDDLAETVAKHPKNYIALGTLPMQSTDHAVKECERIAAMGFKGVQIGSNINNLNLNEAQFFPIYEACERLGLALLIHPWEMMGFDHIQKYWLPWLVGMPAETARAIASMIFGGVFDRFPNLRVNFAHAGGSFIPTIGRLEHGFNCRPDLVAVDNHTNPREYLGRFWVDSITHDAQLLRYVIDTIGIEKITLGSDYPFPLGDLEIGAYIEKMELSENEVNAIFSTNTADWLQLNLNDYQ
jgi:aminocarboxymuconate-semialdehyde decarboxylase